MKLLIQVLLWGLSLLQSNVCASELSERLASNNHVLLMRHALAPGVGDPLSYSLERCETQRNLDDEGRRQAVRTGQWLRQQGVVLADLYASVWCRCQHTAELLQLGAVKTEPSLASFFDEPHKAADQNKDLQAFIAKRLAQKDSRALILVTHHVNIFAYMGKNIGSGDMVLVRVDAAGQMKDFTLYPSP